MALLIEMVGANSRLNYLASCQFTVYDIAVMLHQRPARTQLFDNQDMSSSMVFRGFSQEL
jgi:hypothetical protein